MAISSAVSPEDQRSKICWLRCMFVASLLTATAVCSATVFSVIRRLQVDLGEQNFLSVANSALKGAQAISRRKVIALQSLAETHAHTFPNASQWPFVAMPGYSEAARLLANISSSVTIGTQVILRPDQVSDFEDFAAQTYRNRGYSESAGMSEFGFGMFRNDPQNSNTSDGRIHDVYRNDALPTKHNVSVPIFQCSDKNSKILLFNAYSEKFRRNAIDSMLDCASSSSSSQQNLSRSAEPPSSCGRITDFVELVSRPGPAAVIFQPICPKNDPTIIVGFVATTTHWVEMLTDVVPDYVDGLFCVIATPQSAKTFVITNGIPELLGEGDLHDRAFDKYAIGDIVTEIQSAVSLPIVYNLTLYPSNRLMNEFQTKSSVGVALGYIAVLLFSTVLFFLYDFFMRHQSHQRKIILEVKRRFVRFVSHEIRTPLNTVCLGLELLQAELNTTDKKEANCNENGTNLPFSSLKSGDKSVIVRPSMRFDDDTRDRWLGLTDDILENAHNAVGILNDLLDYDKIEQDTFKLDVGTVNIWKLVRATVSSFKIQADKRNMSLLFTIADINATCVDDAETGKKPSFSRLQVVGDDSRLRHVVRNLISNSLKFSPENTGVIHVTLSFHPAGLPNAKAPKADTMQKVATTELACIFQRMGSIVITVEDNGVGLTQEQLNLLFNEGVQFEANKLQSGGGSGLGLHITKGLVEKHGGTIAIVSAGLGEGATVTVELPLFDCPELDTVESPDSNSQTECINSLVSLNSDKSTESCSMEVHHVLVVDDAVTNRKMLVRLLERAGHKCSTACNGQDAISVFEAVSAKAKEDPSESPIDTILMDYEMPVLNGPLATQKLRQHGCQALVIGVTGNVLAEDVKYFKDMGADEVFAKPVQVSLIEEYWQKCDWIEGEHIP